MAITGGGVREVFETILPEDVLMSAVRAAGLQEREAGRRNNRVSDGSDNGLYGNNPGRTTGQDHPPPSRRGSVAHPVGGRQVLTSVNR